MGCIIDQFENANFLKYQTMYVYSAAMSLYHHIFVHKQINQAYETLA